MINTYIEKMKEEYVYEVKLPWKTFASQYKEEKQGSAEIRKLFYPKGYYLMEGINAYVFWHIDKQLQYTSLFINEKEWMLDDPLHWSGMQEFAKRCSGSVLVGGLGLGLLVSQLILNNKVNSITVIERNNDVIDLISKYLESSKLEIINDDYLHFITRNYRHTFDFSILDFWVLDDQSTKFERQQVNKEISIFYDITSEISKNTWVWGIGDKKYNPVFVDSDMLRKLKRELLGGKHED